MVLEDVELKKYRSNPLSALAQLLILTVLGGMVAGRVSAEVEINLDEISKPAAKPSMKSAPVPTAIPKQPTAVPTAVPVQQPAAVRKPTDTPTKQPMVGMTPTIQPVGAKNEEPALEPSPAAEMVQGSFKMKYIYESGIKYYQALDYDNAIRYLTQAVKRDDPNTAKYYYAEAYATLGIIYQFHIIDYKKAYDYYKAALKYEKNNPTAKKHIREVIKFLHRKS